MNFTGLLPASLVEWVRVILVAFLVAAVSYPLGQCEGRKEGKRIERAAWVLEVNRLKALAEKLQRDAEVLRQSAERLDRERIERNRQEVEDAVRDIADQATSPRQRARACLELRRQGQNPPACQSQPAPGSSRAPR